MWGAGARGGECRKRTFKLNKNITRRPINHLHNRTAVSGIPGDCTNSRNGCRRTRVSEIAFYKTPFPYALPSALGPRLPLRGAFFLLHNFDSINGKTCAMNLKYLFTTDFPIFAKLVNRYRSIGEKRAHSCSAFPCNWYLIFLSDSFILWDECRYFLWFYNGVCAISLGQNWGRLEWICVRQFWEVVRYLETRLFFVYGRGDLSHWNFSDF